jgi:putative nucleotide binding protein
LEKRYEEYAYVLDFFSHGRSRLPPYRAGALVQVVGEDYFTLLEAVVKEGITLKPQDRVSVGKDARNKITYIIRRIGYEELTGAAKTELVVAVEKIVLTRDNWFIGFFNKAQAITPRMHALELIPGIGKKYMWQILGERENSSFKSLKDLQQRTNLPDPFKLVAKRVLEELTSKSKYRLFTRQL